MSKVNIIRAWKDEAYRMSLSEAERAALPANPAGEIELSAAALDQVAGGAMIFQTAGQRVGVLESGGGNGCGTGQGTGGNCTGDCCKTFAF
jgi:mersacidin/lichenicidin family type 2 lantibiotic